MGRGSPNRGDGMTAKRQAYVPARFLKLYRGQAAVLAVGKPEFEVVRELTEADLVHLFRAERRRVPAICELLMCLAADPEFHKDRLADYQERFNGHWVPKFGHRAAVALYVWHVLRQSRLIDWLIRAFRLGDGL